MTSLDRMNVCCHPSLPEHEPREVLSACATEEQDLIHIVNTLKNVPYSLCTDPQF
jgi:hypothetical protein